MDGYLSKPVNAQELIEKVERLGGREDCKLQLANCKLQIEDPSASRPSAVPDSSVFNLDEAMAQLGDAGLFREMVGFFFGDAARLLREIRTAAAAGDATAIERKAHRLKGTVLYLGAETASRTVAAVEELARLGDLTAAASAIPSMETEIARLAEALGPYRQCQNQSQ